MRNWRNGRRGGFRNQSKLGCRFKSCVSQYSILNKTMPQLDALTYFTQYSHLLITFIAVYYFALSVIIPKTVSILKMRHKLNSLNSAPIKGQGSSTIDNAQLKVDNAQFSKLFSQYDSLLNNHWLIETSNTRTREAYGQWLVSASVLQLAQVVRLKKLLCSSIVRKITK